MNIIYNQETKTFFIETLNTSYVMFVDKINSLRHLYYGKKIRHECRG